MKSIAVLCLAALSLTACKEEHAALPQAVEMTEEALGFYCQMDLLTHDGPKGQIHLDGMPGPIFFSQVRDAIAYLHMPEQSHAIQVAYVQDMAGAANWATPESWMPLTEAYYVIGSDKLGGMNAPEFVPFSNIAAAENFVLLHGGTVKRYSEITTNEVLAPTAPSLPASSATDSSDIASRLRALSSSQRTN
ncbi:nitrous oxide reductase accessory protein NosL [Cognatishimia sp. WU-CL00825]|uniref:nitrous oxide reductase accessory protein NosL n=1 Tax=Cognatishimia sp. WU-CL00825 TaxID=3127658 RepID=UPI00310A96B1